MMQKSPGQYSLDKMFKEKDRRRLQIPGAFKMPPRNNLLISEVAALMRVSESKVRGWITDEKLAAFKDGQTVRISKQAYRRFLYRHNTLRLSTDEKENKRAAVARIKVKLKKTIKSLKPNISNVDLDNMVSHVYHSTKDDFRI